MCLGSWPGLIGEYAIAVTGVHYSIGGHSHGVERVNDDVLCCVVLPPVYLRGQTKTRHCVPRVIILVSRIVKKLRRRPRSTRTVAIQTSTFRVLVTFSCRGPMLFVGVCCSRAEPACHLLFDANRGGEKESRQQRLNFISLQTDINASKPSPPVQLNRMCLGKRTHSCGPLSPHFLTATSHDDFHNLITRGACHASWMLR